MWAARAIALQPYQRQQFVHPGLDRGARHATLSRTESDIRRHGQMREQCTRLEHRVDRPAVRRHPGEIGAVQDDRPRRGSGETAHRAQQRRLAGTRAAQKDKQLPAPDAQVQPIQRRHCPVTNRQAGDPKDLAQLPALKRAHSRVRNRSAAAGTAPMVK